jgi:hypothetical protein
VLTICCISASDCTAGFSSSVTFFLFFLRLRFFFSSTTGPASLGSDGVAGTDSAGLSLSSGFPKTVSINLSITRP